MCHFQTIFDVTCLYKNPTKSPVGCCQTKCGPWWGRPLRGRLPLLHPKGGVSGLQPPKGVQIRLPSESKMFITDNFKGGERSELPLMLRGHKRDEAT